LVENVNISERPQNKTLVRKMSKMIRGLKK